MDNKTKLMLLKYADSYWTLLPAEIKEMILKYKESQELIEWRERKLHRGLCKEIEKYRRLRRRWFIGHVELRCYYKYACQCQPCCMYMMIFGHYWNLLGVKSKTFLDFDFKSAMAYCDDVKNNMQYQTNATYTLSVLSM